MSITASMVKELRERTGAGMMDCKKALGETDGDLETAIDLLRKKGAASADKKAARVAAEGIVASAIAADGTVGVLVEINSETDFVAKEASFLEFTAKLADLVLAERPADVAALSTLPMDSGSVDDVRRALVGKIGENIGIRRFYVAEAPDGGRVTEYLHQGSRIGVLVSVSSKDGELGRDLAMHIAATNPGSIDESGMSPDVLAKEKAIFLEQARESGKPDDIAEKMVVGRMKKFLKENTLLGQGFVKDPDVSVQDLLKKNNAEVTAYTRYEVGDGIEKKEDDFVAEVMAQAKS